MNYTEIRKGLSKYNDSEVTRYINYLKQLETDKDWKSGKPKNAWFAYFKETQAIDIYKKVAIDGLSIDGDTITLQYKGKVMVSYNYQAYKNRVLNIYPETLFDIQIVQKGDNFSFRKENGKVIYSHKINDPFNPNPEIIGTYCIIKNKRGEFLETLNITDIQKMRNVAKTKNVWDEWFSEMVLKSVIKRACKRHFRDVTNNIDALDNENYDLDRVSFDEEIQKKIDEAQTIADLAKLYKEEENNVTDKVAFITLLTVRKEELRKMLPELAEADKSKAIKMLKAGKSTDDLLNIWKISDEDLQTLVTEAL